MSAEVMENWLKSGKNGVIFNILLKPLEHNKMKGKPLSSQKGQAEAFFMIDDQGRFWILKKFHNGCALDRHYLDTTTKVLPNEPGFECGTKRHILKEGNLENVRGFHYNHELDNWLNRTILMPRIDGVDWSFLAGDIREGKVKLDLFQRFELCRMLSNLVWKMEKHQCSHRDLSCGNVFIDFNTGMIYLIDFDSLYHPSLKMPQATTCGTEGYTSHLAWSGDKICPSNTWCTGADRYALAILNTEFLLMDYKIHATGEGGLFLQQELRHQSGKGISQILSQLNSKWPPAAQLLDAAINSNSFSYCPSPDDWVNFFNSVPALVPPSIDEFQQSILKLPEKAQIPVPKPPGLDEFSDVEIKLPQAPSIKLPRIELFTDPWANK